MIDKRRHYVLVVDTETANTLTETIPAEIGENGEIITPERIRMDMSNVLVYDCGVRRSGCSTKAMWRTWCAWGAWTSR